MNAIVPPMASETRVKDLKVTCSPKKYPKEVTIIAHMNDAIKKMNDVSLVRVFASPATIGMKALTDGVSFPKKIHHIPRRENVS